MNKIFFLSDPPNQGQVIYHGGPPNNEHNRINQYHDPRGRPAQQPAPGMPHFINILLQYAKCIIFLFFSLAPIVIPANQGQAIYQGGPPNNWQHRVLPGHELRGRPAPQPAAGMK